MDEKPKGLYRHIRKIILIMLLLQLPSSYAVCIYGVGVYGEGIYGGGCPTGGVPEEGSAAFWSVPLTIPNNSGLINGTCREKQQVFNGYCYDCDPLNSYLNYLNTTKTLTCNTCNPGYLLYNNDCITSQDFGNTISSQSSKINLSFFLLILAILLVYYWNEDRIKKRKVVEADREDED